MPWVTVKDFDRDVKVGDKIKMDQDCKDDWMEVVYIKKNQFVADHNYEMLEVYNKSLNDATWQVWRESKRWRGLAGAEFYFATHTGNVTSRKDMYDENDNLLYEIGFYFRTKEQAQEYADECKKVAERLHERFKE